MQITFLIGNGFDLNAGLQTRFTDFFKVYCQEKDSDSNAIKIFKREIGNNVEQWADFEWQMGQFTTHVRPMGLLTSKAYDACIEDFRNNLVRYLKEQEENISVLGREYKVKDKCWEMLQDPFRCLRDGQRVQLQNYLRKQPEPLEVLYNFIVFNYTTTCERCMLDVLKAGGGEKTGYCSIPDMKADIRSGRLVHVHGSLEGVILLGVDNDSQIVNPELCKDEEFRYSYIKPVSNRELEARQDKAAEEMIQSSSIIVIYGMSIGDTDETWWEQIAYWLNEGRNTEEHFLVVYSYDGTMNRNSAKRTINNQKEIRRKFVKTLEGDSNITEDDKKYVANHIFCALNTDILQVDKE